MGAIYGELTASSGGRPKGINFADVLTALAAGEHGMATIVVLLQVGVSLGLLVLLLSIIRQRRIHRRRSVWRWYSRRSGFFLVGLFAIALISAAVGFAVEIRYDWEARSLVQFGYRFAHILTFGENLSGPNQPTNYWFSITRTAALALFVLIAFQAVETRSMRRCCGTLGRHGLAKCSP